MTPPPPAAHTTADTVLDRLIRDNRGDEPWADLVLATCNGPAALEAALDGHASPRPVRPGPTSSADGPAPEPPGAYLRGITVEGFRGIGPAATLTLTPGPGLTLVVGRNGSGKSSFAEGLEVLLTGRNKRWDNRAVVWKQGWRCLHGAGPTAVRAEFAVEALGSVTVERQWDDGAAVDECTAWFQAKGAPRQPYEQLGWDTAIRTHRPLLPYTELGAVFDRPSDIHDALVEVLGLGEFDAILKALQTVRKGREAVVATASARLTALLPRVREVADASGDQRAVSAARALSGKQPDLHALRRVLDEHGDDSADTSVTALRQAARDVHAPSRDDVTAAVRELREAADAVEQSRGTDAGRARALARLLDETLRYHEAHAVSDCPACGTAGVLRGAWREETLATLADLRARADAADRAHARLDRATLAARALLRVQVTGIEPVAALGVASATPALAAVAGWNQGASLTDVTALAAHLEHGVDALCASLDAVRADVHAELARREDRWRPIATELREWVPQGLAAEAAQTQVAQLKKAEKWFKDVQDDLRAERFRPIAERAKAIWRQLRQQSNVELEDVALEGTATKRSVALDVTVDGVRGAALGVMSQGELNALALSLFMPRASLAESPFRFMVIDDPVQSMDPSRVDGLARALHEAARTRQVVVFTHDDRLPEALRHLQIPATVIEVTRRPGSVVDVREVKSPVRRYFDDAMAIVKTRDLPMDVQRRLVPGFCRLGIEAACAAAIRRRRLKAGAPHAEIEEVLANQKTSMQQMALALFDDGDRGGEVLKSLNNRWGASAADVFRAVNTGAHEGYEGELERLTREAERLAARIGDLS